MTEPLLDRISKRMREKTAPRSGKTRATIIAMRDDIQKSLDAGWSVRTIWQTLHDEGSIAVGYETFLRQAQRLLPKQSPTRHGAAADTKPAQPPTQPAPGKTGELPQHHPAKPRHFVHNPVPDPKRLYGDKSHLNPPATPASDASNPDKPRHFEHSPVPDLNKIYGPSK
ncbi:MAG TPA: TraK family protein [Polyangiales bacterium]